MRSGYVALVGRPNVGKSTLMNSLIGQKIAITSGKPQTTRNRIETVYTDERGQIIFVDTPGIHKAKNRLGQYMDDVAEKSFGDCDVIMWIVEPSKEIGSNEEHILELLSARSRSCPVVLVLNKSDKLGSSEDQRRALELYTERLGLEITQVVSAKEGTGLEELLSSLFSLLPEGPIYYDEDVVTMMPMRSIAEELIREQALRLLSDEIPHGIAVVIESFKEKRPGFFVIEADIICERESHKGMIIGKGGSMLKRIGTGARLEIEAQLDARVDLRLFVKVRKGWRDNEGFIRSFGYNLKR